MFNNLLLLTQTEGREREARGREAKRMREEHQRKTQGDEMEWYMGGKGLKRGSSNLRPENRRRGRRGLEMEIKSRKRRCMMEQVEGQQRRKVGASEEHGRIFWTPLNILWLPKEKKQQQHGGVTNKVTLRDQKHKRNALPVKVQPFRSSKASKPSAPYGQTQYRAALILKANQQTAKSQTRSTSKSATFFCPCGSSQS